jgi:flagellar hook-associated protein 2
MAVGSISVSGLASGLPSDIVDQLMQAENRRLSSLQTQRSTYQGQQGAVSTLKSKLLSLQTKMVALQDASSFSPRTASSSDEDVLKVSASSDASAGFHTVDVDRLARYQTVVSSGGLASRSTAAVDSGGGSITFNYNGVAQTITLDGDATLNDVARAITNHTYVDADGNEVEATEGVTGSVMYDGTQYRLVLAPRDSGAQSDDSQRISGVSITGVALVDTSGNADVSTTETAGVNAQATINGITVKSSTNSLSLAIPGVTLELKKEGLADVSVTNDSSSLKTTVNDFVTAYNDVANYIRTATQKDGSLSKDAMVARSVISRLRTEINTPTSSTVAPYASLTPYSTLAQIGIQTDKDTGALSLDSTKFDAAVEARFDAVSSIFTSEPSASDAGSFTGNLGLAHRLEDALKSFTTATSGALSARSTGLTSRISSIDRQITREETRLERVREQLTKKFASLEQLSSSMNSSMTSLQNSLSKL